MQTVLTNGKTSRPVEDVIRDRLENGNGNTLLFIVPTEQARLKRQRECLGHAPYRALTGLNIYTFENLIKRLARHTGAQRPVSRALQMLWLRGIVNGGQYPALKAGDEIPLPDRTIAELLNAINQLKTNGIDASKMRAESADSMFHELTADAGALADFVTIYENFSERLGDQWTDWASVHGAIADRLAKEKKQRNRLIRSNFPDVDLVVAESIDVFAGADLSILEGIVQLPGLVTYVTFDWDAQNNDLFGHVEQRYTRFLELGFHQVGELENCSSWNSTVAEHFSQNLFRKIEGVRPSVEKLNLTNCITLVKTRDRVKEVEAVAEFIKGQILDGSSSALHRICLTYYNLERYVPLIRELFPIYGVPYTLHEETPLSTSPFAGAFFSLLDKIDENVTSRSEERLQNPYFIIENLAQVAADCEFDSAMSPSAFRQSVASLIQISRPKQQILNQEGTVLREVHPSIIEQEIGAFGSVESLIAELVEFLSSHHGDKRPHPLRSYIDWLRFMASQQLIT